jgi:hypothetical protein
MFQDLKAPLKQGDNFKATLEFERAGKVDVNHHGLTDDAWRHLVARNVIFPMTVRLLRPVEAKAGKSQALASRLSLS